MTGSDFFPGIDAAPTQPSSGEEVDAGQRLEALRERRSMHLRQPRTVTSTQLGFVRAALNGIPLVKAYEIYLSQKLDQRLVRGALKALNREIAQAALVHPDAKLRKTILAGFDPKKAEQCKAQISALTALEPSLNARPAAEHPTAAWLEPAQCERLATIGVETVGELVIFINLNGYRWFDRVPAFGAGKAKKVVDWLLKYEEQIGAAVNTAALYPAATVSTALVPMMPGTQLITPGAIAPLAHANVPVELRGDQGTFRQFGPNTLGATSDYEAIQAWLRKYDRQKATQRSYSKEAERFYLWCLLVKKKAMSSLTGPDCADYRLFLERLPADWIQQTNSPASRHSGHWRPFRKKLSSSSIKQALVILQSMFESLRKESYLSANAMDYVLHNHTKGTARLHIERRFTDREWDHLMNVAAGEEGAEGRRLRLALELLVSTGLRREEMANATYGGIEEVELENGDTAKILNVVGKRNRLRDVLLSPKVLGLLEQHRKDRIERGLLDEQKLLETDIPLIGALARPPAAHLDSALSTSDAEAAATGALSPDSLYRLLKRFFARCIETLPSDLTSKSFTKGSTHWLRHTAATRALTDGASLQVVKELLGHTSISTTSIYINPEREQRIRELNKLDLGRFRPTPIQPPAASHPAAPAAAGKPTAHPGWSD